MWLVRFYTRYLIMYINHIFKVLVHFIYTFCGVLLLLFAVKRIPIIINITYSHYNEERNYKEGKRP